MGMKMKTKEDRLQDERNFHNEIFESRVRYEKVGKFYSMQESIYNEFEKRIFNDVNGKAFLHYGCGMGDTLLKKISDNGGVCHGIDISDYAINELLKKHPEINYRVMDAEELEYDDGYFDIVYGTGILHHLNLDSAYHTISAKLKKSGKAVFIEPLGHNPLINKFRDKTPELRTEDEHPFLMKDIELAEKYFGNIKVTYYHLSTLALPVIFGNNTPGPLISLFNSIDKALFFVLPFLRKHSWQVIIEFSEPGVKAGS
jgi:ubiquinone/menaquinone biosynthesis C-methylase UbiE